MSILGWIGWVVLGLLPLWFFSSMRFSHTKRLNVRTYVIYLLLSDEIREDHKRKLHQWIRGAEMKDPHSLNYAAQNVVEVMADGLAEAGSLLAAGAMVWKVKTGDWEG